MGFPDSTKIKTALHTWGLVLLAAVTAAQDMSPDTRPRSTAQVVERELRGGETQTYSIKLQQGEFLRVTVEQRGIDVGLTLRNGLGAELLNVNLLAGPGTEPLSYEAPEAGTYRLEVVAVAAPAASGRYAVTSVISASATAQDRERMAAERVLMEVAVLAQTGGTEKLREAIVKGAQGISLWRKLADKYWLAYACNQIGHLHRDLGERPQALDYYRQALALYEAIGDLRGEIITLENMGNVFAGLGDKQQAIASYRRTLPLLKTTSDRSGEAKMAFTLGWYYAELGEQHKALKYFKQALPLYNIVGDREGTARLLDNIGRAHDDLGRTRTALKYYKRALTLARTIHDHREEAVTLSDIGILYSRLGDKRAALAYYEQSLPAWKVADDKQGEAITLTNLGLDYGNLGERRHALAYYQRALPLFRLAKDRNGEVHALDNIAGLYLSLGEQQKALECYQQILGLLQGMSDRMAEALTLSQIGTIYDDLKDHHRALEYSQKALPLWQGSGNRAQEAATLYSIASAFNNLEEYQKALEYYRQVLPLWQQLNERNKEIDTLNTIAGIYFVLGEKPKTVDCFNQVLALQKTLGDHAGEAETLGKLGVTHYLLGEKQKAWAYFDQSLALLKYPDVRRATAKMLLDMPALFLLFSDFHELSEYYQRVSAISRAHGDRSLRAAALVHLGTMYSLQDDETKALNAFQQALSLYRAAGALDDEAAVLNAIGNVYLSKQTTAYLQRPTGQDSTQYLTEVLARIRADSQEARQIFYQALSLYRTTKNRHGEVQTLLNISGAYYKLDNNQEALNYCQQALFLNKEIPDPVNEAGIYSRLMEIWVDLSSPQLAILYGKQAVNALQSLRADIFKIDRGLERSFVDKVSDAYRDLASLLIKEGRLLEAEQVLAMLKEEEFFRFVRRDDKVAKDLLTRINLAPAEREALERYDKIAEDIVRLGQEYGQLEAERLRLPPEQTGSIIAKQHAIQAKLRDMRETLRLFVGKLKEEFGAQDKRVATVEEGLQATVNRWHEPRTGVISTIVGKDSLYMILTTAEGQKAYIVGEIAGAKFSEEKLNALIVEFRAACKNPAVDPRPAGQKLYDVLFKQLEKDLQSINADTLVWSLDANLRYVPVAALYDAQHGYLAERYANVIITLASQSGLELHPADKNSWQALGLGVSKSVAGFPALVNVPEELRAIVRDTEQPDERGLLNGRRLLDEQFTLAAFELYLGRYKVIHAATHFSFIPSTRSESLGSFLLLGSGEKLTLEQVQKAGPMFNGVELLVLSACETAAGGKGADGSEVEGFGVLAQKAGARTVIATLWPVADASTRELMVKFYQLQGTMPNMTKAEALRRAQLALLANEQRANGTQPRAELVGREPGQAQESAFPTNAQKPYAHPYYWAPFMLMGNWR